MKTVRYGDWRVLPKRELSVDGRVYPVCTFANPTPGRFLVTRRAEGWLLTPVTFTEDGHGRCWPNGEFILLINAPEEVNDAMALILDTRDS